MRSHRVVVLDVLTKHPPPLPFVDGDDVIEALAPERPDHPLGDGVGVRRAPRSQNRLDPDPSSACDEVPAIATVAVSDEEPWLLTPGGRLDHLPPDPGRDRVLRDVPVPDAAPTMLDHDEHVERAEGERLDREQVGGPDPGRVVPEKRAPRLTRRSPQRLLAVTTHRASANLEAKRTQLTDDAHGSPPRVLGRHAHDQLLQLGGDPRPNDKVALIHRNRGDDVFYLFPGGQVEDNESTEQAAIREIHEELGLTIAVDRLVAVVSRNGAEQYHFSATILGGEFGTGEGAEMGSYTAVWLPISGLARQPLRPLQLARLVVAAHKRGWPADPIRFNDDGVAA